MSQANMALSKREGSVEMRSEGTSELTRRNFFMRAIGALSGGIAASIAIPSLGFVLSPIFKASKPRGLMEVGPLSRFPVGSPTLASIVLEDSGGTLFKQGVYVVNHGKGKFDVFRLNCTHLGCPYEWNDAAGKFFCPCHGGVFDISGNVVAGPPPRPLDRYRPVIKGGTLYAGELLMGGKSPVA